MNSITLTGRTTKDPEVRYGGNNGDVAVTKFSLAVDRKFKQDEVDFFNCVAFGKLGEFAKNYLGKGVKIIVTGRIESDEYTNRDGVRIRTWQVIASEIEFAESKRREEPKQEPKQDFVTVNDDVDDGELPFN